MRKTFPAGSGTVVIEASDTELAEEMAAYARSRIRALEQDGFCPAGTGSISGASLAIWSKFENGEHAAFLVMPSGEITWGHGSTLERASADLVDGVRLWLGCSQRP